MKGVLLTGILLVHAAAFAQSAKGTIVGRVLGPDGTPAANVRVVALELPNAKGVYSADPIFIGTTDAAGRYRLSDVPPGRYGVFVNIRSSYDVSAQDLDSAPGTIVQPGASAVRDISLPPIRGVTVGGRLRTALVTRDLREVLLSADGRFLRTRVGLDGSFSFRNVVPGKYQLSMPVSQFVWGAREILVEDQDVAGVELIPDDSIGVVGRVVTEGGAPVPSFSFSLDGPKGFTRSRYMWVQDSVQSSGMAGVSGWSDRPDDVIFTASLPIGEYRIAVTDLPPGYRVKSFTYGETDLFAKTLNVTGEIRQLSIVLTASEPSNLVKVRGRLIRDVVLPLELVSERVVLQSNRLLAPLETAIGRDGSFELSGVPPGVYGIRAPNLGWMLVVGNEDVRGLEFRNSRIRARYDEAVRAAANPPARTPEEQTTEDRVDSVAKEPTTSAKRVTVSAKRVTVSGRVTGPPNSTGLNGFEVVLPGDPWVMAPLDSEGRFTFTEVLPGLYDIHASAIGVPYAALSNVIRIVVRDTNIGGLELRIPPAKKKVSGRIIVEGGYPLPLVALTVRQNVDAGPPFAHPRTMRSEYPDGGFVLQGDGRFVIELSEGRHRLRVDGYPEDSYWVKSVRYGTANLDKDLMEIDGGNLKELVITFSADPVVFWPRVRGQISGMGNLSEAVRVVLLSVRTMLRFEAVPKADGSFEFPKVHPDTYTVLTTPRVAAITSRTIVVAGREVAPVDLAIPSQHNVNLRITAEGGGQPSNLALVLTLNKTEAYMINLSLPFILRTASEWVCVVDVCSMPVVRSAGEPTVLSASPGEGRYSFRLPEGEYRVELNRIPADYELKSFTHGAVDLREAPLRVGPTTPGEIAVTLSVR